MKKTIPLVLALVVAAVLVVPARAGVDLDRQPVATYQVAPDYPFSLRMQGKSGTVMIQFTVELDGTVSHPEVVESSHPDFEAPAVEAVLKWTFKPGMKNGHVVYTRMQVPILFQLREMPDGSNGYPMWHVPKSVPKNFPEQFRYDDPPMPLVMSAPVYPLELLRKKVTGKASVSFVVDPAGRTELIKVQSASQPEFGAATAAMVGAWTFQPAKKGGKDSWALLSFEQEFNSYADAFPMNESAARLLKDLKRDPCPIIASARLLDGMPKARFQPSPVIPEALLASHTPANAVVEFVIDHAGHAQLPRVVSATDPDFGWAAATAVARWQFTSPTKNGKPVDIFVRIPLAYIPDKSGTAGP